MKRILAFIALFLACAAVYAQPNNPQIQYVTVAPSGACPQAPPVQVLNSSGAIYTCNNGTWAASGGGSGTVSGVIYATSYGVKADTKIVKDASTTSSSGIVTCPNNDCAFTSADVGKVCFATNATDDVSQLTSTVILARGTISTVNSATSVTCSTTASSSVTGAATFVWGTPDSAIYSATQSTANDPLLAAWTAAVSACQPLILPGGNLLVEQPEFNIDGSASCSLFNSQAQLRQGYYISGQGPNATVIVISPALVASNCTGPNGGGNGCFLSAHSVWASNFQLFGAGNSAPGSGFATKYGIAVPGTSPGVNFDFNNVFLYGWGANQPGFQGVNVGQHTANGISGGWFDHTHIEGFGYTAVVIDPNYTPSNAAPISFVGSLINTCNTCLDVKNGTVNSTNSLYGYTPTSGGGDAIDIEGTAIFNSTNDFWYWQGTAGTSQLNVAGIANIANAYINGSSSGQYPITNTGTTSLANSYLTSTSGTSINNSGTVNLDVATRYGGAGALSGAGPYNKASFTTSSAYQDFATFIGTNGTALSSYTTSAGKTFTQYTNSGGSPQAMPALDGSGNELLSSGTNATLGDVLDTLTPSSADYTVGETFNYVSSSASTLVALFGRAASGSQNYYVVQCTLETHVCSMYKDVSGVTTAIGSPYTIPGGWTVGTSHTMQLVMVGTAISMTFDGTPNAISATDSAVSATGQGGSRISGGGHASGTLFFIK